MSLYSPVPAIAALLLALLCSFFLVKLFGRLSVEGRFLSIDGLRGYLAFFVFVHHSSIWYVYLHTGVWALPQSHLYSHLGRSSIALFFMITGFLFFSKIIDSRQRPIDWFKLYVSRILRLFPLYLFLMFPLFAVIWVLSNGTLHDRPIDIAKQIGQWIGFTIFGDPDINGVLHTSKIVGGLTWSLVYEWFFYLSLPLLSLMAGTRAPLRYLLLSAGVLALALVSYPSMTFMVVFMGGIAAAVAVRNARWCRVAVSPIASLVAIGCAVAGVIVYPSPFALMPLSLLTVTFIIIASGNDLFGILSSQASRQLGEMAYGIYLLHGISLYLVMTSVIGVERALLLSPQEYWTVVITMIPVLIGICFATSRLIEQPAMRSAERVTRFLRTLNRKRDVAVTQPDMP